MAKVFEDNFGGLTDDLMEVVKASLYPTAIKIEGKYIPDWYIALPSYKEIQQERAKESKLKSLIRDTIQPRIYIRLGNDKIIEYDASTGVFRTVPKSKAKDIFKPGTFQKIVTSPYLWIGTGLLTGVGVALLIRKLLAD